MNNNFVIRFAVEMFFNEDDDDEERACLQKVKNFAEETVPNFTNRQFKLHFRMEPSTFEELLTSLNSLDNEIYKGGNPETPLEKQQQQTIWYLVNIESFRSVADRFGLSTFTAWSSLYKVCRKLLIINERKNVISFPNLGRCNEIIRNFKNKTGFPGVLGAIDGSHIPIIAPKINHAAYINRKGFHSVLLQAVCDHRKKFNDCYAGEVGSNHDSCVYRRSPFGQNLRNRDLPGNSHLVGDSAYPLSKNLMTPYKNNGHLNNIQKKYNTVLSTTRVIIEHAFALLKGRFRRLKMLEAVRLDLIPLLIMSSCILHNICLDANDVIDLNLEAEVNEEQLIQPINPELVVPLFNDGEDKRTNIANFIFTLD